MGTAKHGKGPVRTLSFKGKDYRVDPSNSLVDPADWDEGFAAGMAPEVGLAEGLTEKHWEVIRLIRRIWEERGYCPTVYEVCRILRLHVAGLGYLFPDGYQEGACLLSGLSFRTGFSPGFPGVFDAAQVVYRIDFWGFLADPDEWDEHFALLKAQEMKVPGGLTSDHWEVIRFLRQEYFRVGRIPTVSETCKAVEMGLGTFRALFPDGFHRGAVKIAGLPAQEAA